MGWQPPNSSQQETLTPVPKEDVIKLLDSFGAKGNTSQFVMSAMWAKGWVIMQGPIPKMRITD